MSANYTPKTAFSRAVHTFEETFIAVILGLMTLITFTNVVFRYIFNASLIWGLELTLILFSWLVLFGVSHAIKITAHLGVDSLIGLVAKPKRRVLAIITSLICVTYAFLLLKGGWDYFAPFAGLERTSGRIFPMGFEATRNQAWYETESIPMLDLLRFIEGPMNSGEAYNKIPRFIPYAIIPVGMALLLMRCVVATYEVFVGSRDSLIVSHEVEDAIAELQAQNKEAK